MNSSAGKSEFIINNKLLKASSQFSVLLQPSSL